MGIIVQVQLWKAPAFINYLDIIHRAYNSFIGPAFVHDDDDMWASLGPSIA